jgi:hypothetical protein
MLLFLCINLIINSVQLFLFSKKSLTVVKALLIIIILIIISTYQQSSGTLFDTGAYHVVIAKWVSNHGLVKGIANLDPHYGLFSPVFIIAGFLELIFEFHSWQILNGILFSVVSVRLICAYSKENQANYLLFAPAFLAVLFYSRMYIPTISPDLWVNIAIPIVLLMFYRISTNHEVIRLIQLLVPTLVFLIWVKWSSVPLLLTFIVLLIFKSKEINWNLLFHLKVWFWLSIVIILTMFVVNTIISGYPLYPITFINFNLSWQVPIERVNGLSRHIYLWGISSNYESLTDYSFTSWFPQWWNRNFNPNLYQKELILLLLLPLQLVYLHYKHRVTKYGLILIVFSIIQLSVWFIGSPNPRFLIGFIWTISGITFGQILIDSKSFTKSFKFNFQVALFLILVSYVFAHMAMESGIRSKLLKVDINAWIKPYNAPIPEYEKFILENGVYVNIPIPSKQPWYIPLPSSRQKPVFAIGSIESGFFPTEEAKEKKTVF